MKTIYNFLEKSELQKLIQVKISWLIFPGVSRVEMNNIQRSEEAHLLVVGKQLGFTLVAKLCSQATINPVRRNMRFLTKGLHMSNPALMHLPMSS